MQQASATVVVVTACKCVSADQSDDRESVTSLGTGRASHPHSLCNEHRASHVLDVTTLLSPFSHSSLLALLRLLLLQSFNISHRVNSLSFGVYYPGA